MKPKYKNVIFNTLRESYFGLDNFIFENLGADESKHDVFRITFLENEIPSPFGFIVRQNPDAFEEFDCSYSRYSPKMDYSDFLPPDGYYDIKTICEILLSWIEKQVKSYVEDKDEIDLWEEYSKTSQFQPTKGIDFTETGEFKYDEKQQIILALQSLNININRNFQLNTEQLKLVNDGIKYLTDGVERLNKLDWKTILIGQFFTIATAIAANPKQFAALYQMFLKVIHVVYFLPQ